MKPVSIIIPCRNEEGFIAKCLDSVIANDYPKDKLEVLIIDGMSEDRTREIAKKYAEGFRWIKLLENPKKITPCALNIGVKNAEGEIIMRMDAHATYEKEYISKCIKYLKEYDADNVGGIWKIIPRHNTIIGRGIANVLSHPFGVGNAYYRFADKEPRWVDTTPFFCYKKEVFEKIGFFNESLARSQDMEFNLRLKKSSGKILLVPDIISYYYARSDLKSFIKYNFINGLWAILPFKYTNIIPVSLRHMIPLVFVLSLTGFGLLSLFNLLGLIMLLVIVGLYLLLNLYFSVQISIREKDARLLFLMPAVFTTLHISYGLGSAWGLIRCLISRGFWLNQLFKRHHEAVI